MFICSTSISLSPTLSLPSLAAAPSLLIRVMKMLGSPGIYGLSLPPRMLKPRPLPAANNMAKHLERGRVIDSWNNFNKPEKMIMLIENNVAVLFQIALLV